MAIKVSGIVVIDDNRNISANDIYSNGAEVLTTATTNLYVKSIIAGTDTAVSTSTNSVTIWNTSTLQSITSRGAFTDVPINITNATNSTSTNSGSLTVSGGVGIGGNLFVGGSIVGTLDGNSSSATTATSAATAYALANTSTTYVGRAALADVVTTATSAATAYALANTSTTYVGRAVLADESTLATTATSAATAYALANTSTTYVGRAASADIATLANNASLAATAYELANTGTTYVGRASLADLATLATTANSATTSTYSSIAYELANTSTTYVGRAVLADNATTASSAAVAYSLANTSTLYINRSTFSEFSTNILGGSANQIVYQSASSVTNFISSPSVADTCLKWNGSAFIWDIPFNGGTITNVLTILNDTESVSTTSGALVVNGGVGVGKNLNVGGSFRASTGATSQQTIDNASGSIDLNFGLHDHFLLNMTGNVTLSISNLDNKIGCTGNILFQQDSIGGRTFVKPSIMKTPLGGATIVQTTLSNTLSLLTYYVVNTTTVIVNYIGDFA